MATSSINREADMARSGTSGYMARILRATSIPLVPGNIKSINATAGRRGSARMSAGCGGTAMASMP